MQNKNVVCVILHDGKEFVAQDWRVDNDDDWTPFVYLDRPDDHGSAQRVLNDYLSKTTFGVSKQLIDDTSHWNVVSEAIRNASTEQTKRLTGNLCSASVEFKANVLLNVGISVSFIGTVVDGSEKCFVYAVLVTGPTTPLTTQASHCHYTAADYITSWGLIPGLSNWEQTVDVRRDQLPGFLGLYLEKLNGREHPQTKTESEQ